MLDERRLRALYNVQIYKTQILRGLNKKVKPRDLQESDLLSKEIRAPVQDLRRKFKTNWLGSYIIKTILLGGAVPLIDMNGEE